MPRLLQRPVGYRHSTLPHCRWCKGIGCETEEVYWCIALRDTAGRLVEDGHTFSVAVGGPVPMGHKKQQSSGVLAIPFPADNDVLHRQVRAAVFRSLQPPTPVLPHPMSRSFAAGAKC